MPTITATPPITADQFRTDYPEFQDKTKYPDSAVNYWLAVATLMLNAGRWCDILNLGIALFVAHNLVLEAQAQTAAVAGGWPGVSKGAISGETAGSVTVNYDSSMTLEEGAGHWNLTVYGTRFIWLVNQVGAGPVQVGPCGDASGVIPGMQNGVFGPWLF